jgi:hypothetical protein
MSGSMPCLLTGSIDPWAVISAFQTRCEMTGLTDDEDRLERLTEVGEGGFLLLAWDGCDWLARLPEGLNTDALLANLAPKLNDVVMHTRSELSEVVAQVRRADQPMFAVLPFEVLR